MNTFRDRLTANANDFDSIVSDILAVNDKLAEALLHSKGQWIHSVNAEECLKALAYYENKGGDKCFAPS